MVLFDKEKPSHRGFKEHLNYLLQVDAACNALETTLYPPTLASAVKTPATEHRKQQSKASYKVCTTIELGL
jgi:hypothetical protein